MSSWHEVSGECRGDHHQIRSYLMRPVPKCASPHLFSEEVMG